jgi:hypothetical protein
MLISNTKTGHRANGIFLMRVHLLCQQPNINERTSLRIASLPAVFIPGSEAVKKPLPQEISALGPASHHLSR